MFPFNPVFRDVPQADSLCCDLMSGTNDVSEGKSKFVWLTVSLSDQCRHEDSCHSASSHGDDFEADFPLELR